MSSVLLGLQGKNWTCVAKRRWIRRDPASVSKMCKPHFPSPCWPSKNLFFYLSHWCFSAPASIGSHCFGTPEVFLRARDPGCVPLKPVASLKQTWWVPEGGCQVAEPGSQGCSHTSPPALPWQRSGAPRRQQLSPCLCMTRPMSQRRRGPPQKVRGPPGLGSPGCQRMMRGPPRSMTSPGSGRRSGFPKPLQVSPGWRGWVCWSL